MIRIILGDITELNDVDVIVNSAKKTLLGGGGVDGAIHNKAGDELLNACRELHGCNTGEAKITKGYNLAVPYIIHAVGPIYYPEELCTKNDCNQEELLKNAYSNSLRLAKEYNLKRIAFSAISTGVYEYPIEEATKISLDVIVDFLMNNPDFEVTFVLFTEELFEEYINQIKNYAVIFIAKKMNLKNDDINSIEDLKARYGVKNNELLITEEPAIKENIFKKIIKKMFN